MPNLLLSLTQKKKIFYIPPFKRNNEELKANIARIVKSKNSGVNAKVFKLMSKTLPKKNKNSDFVLLVIIVMLLVILGQIVLNYGLC